VSLNICGGTKNEPKRREIVEIFVRRKLDVVSLGETRLKGEGECEFGVPSGRKSSAEEGWAREDVVLLLSDR
jgi:hypothetical protein